MTDCDEASDQQRRPDQQHHGHRHLGGHQQRPCPIVSEARATAIAALFQRAAQIRARRFDSGNESKQNAGQNRQGERESQNAPVEAHIGAAFPDARDVAGAEAQNGADAGVACRQTQNAAGQRQHHAFRKKLPDNPAASGSHRGANRNFPFPARRARQQQIGDIRAGDQQHEADRTQKNQQRIPHAAHDDVLQRLYAESSPLRSIIRPLASVFWKTWLVIAHSRLPELLRVSSARRH